MCIARFTHSNLTHTDYKKWLSFISFDSQNDEIELAQTQHNSNVQIKRLVHEKRGLENECSVIDGQTHKKTSKAYLEVVFPSFLTYLVDLLLGGVKFQQCVVYGFCKFFGSDVWSFIEVSRV